MGSLAGINTGTTLFSAPESEQAHIVISDLNELQTSVAIVRLAKVWGSGRQTTRSSDTTISSRGLTMWTM
jgi:hypothetical protein